MLSEVVDSHWTLGTYPLWLRGGHWGPAVGLQMAFGIVKKTSIGGLGSGELWALTLIILSPQNGLGIFFFQVDGEGFENTLDASSLDFKVPPVGYCLVLHSWKPDMSGEFSTVKKNE